MLGNVLLQRRSATVETRALNVHGDQRPHRGISDRPQVPSPVASPDRESSWHETYSREADEAALRLLINIIAIYVAALRIVGVTKGITGRRGAKGISLVTCRGVNIWDVHTVARGGSPRSCSWFHPLRLVPQPSRKTSHTGLSYNSRNS